MVECPICNMTKKVCRKLGKEDYCDLLVKNLYANKMTAEELIERLHKKFGDRFFKELKREVEKEVQNNAQ